MASAAPTEATERSSFGGRLAVAAAVYVAATLCLTWPLPALAWSHIYDGGGGFWSGRLRADLLLMIWIMRWDIHALATRPLGLFDANIFHPMGGTLALSEHLLGALPIFAPLWAVTGNPVFAFNVWVFASFVLSGLFMHVLVLRWTGSTAAAYVGALAFAFAPWRIPDGLGRAHLLQVQYFPLILLALDRTASTGSLASAVAAAGLLALQALCSYYVGYQAFAAAGAFLLAEVVARGVRGRGANLRALGLAVLLPLAILGPISVPYMLARAHGDLEVAALPAGLGPRTHLVATGRAVVPGYAGWGAALLACLALPGIVWRWWADRAAATRRLAFVAIAIVGLLLAEGPGTLPYDWVAAVVPGFRNIRAAVRFGSLVSFGMSGLGAMAVAGLCSAMRRDGVRARLAAWATAVGAAALVVAPVASARRLAGWPVAVGRSIPASYRWLAARGGGGPLLELPAYTNTNAQSSALAMYYSTYHWLPLVNGYSGYVPRSYEFLAAYAAQLPSPAALELLARCAQVRWVLVHSASPARLRAWARLPGVRLRVRYPRPGGGSDRIYEVIAPAPGGGKCNLWDATKTADGHAVRPLGRLAGRLGIEGIALPVAPGRESAAVIRVENDGSEVWPGTAVARDRAVAVAVRWRTRAGAVHGRPRWVALPHDVLPGQRLEVRFWLRHPRTPGLYLLEAELIQGVAGARPHGGAIRWAKAVWVSPQGGASAPREGSRPQRMTFPPAVRGALSSPAG